MAETKRESVFLDEETQEKAEQARAYLRSQLPVGLNRRITVSDIFRWALDQAVATLPKSDNGQKAGSE